MRLNPLSKSLTWRARGEAFAIGALGVLGLAPFHVWPLALLSLALLFTKLNAADSWQAGYSTAFWAGMGYFSLGMFWIAQAFFERGPAYIPLIIPLVLGLFVLLSIFWGLAGGAFATIRPRRGWDVMAFAGLLFTAEWIRGHLFGGFPWNLHGYAFEAGTALSQLASVVGIYGLTLAALITGGLFGLAWMRRNEMSFLPAGLALLLLGGQYGFGASRLAGAPETPPIVQDVTFRLVQTPFRQREMMDRRTANVLTDRFFTRTFAAPLDGVTHIVWPEGAVRGLAIDNAEFLSVIPRVTGEDAPYFLFSSIRLERSPAPDGTPETRYYNTAVVAGYQSSAPAILGYTDKKRLIPFAEYVPFSDILSAVGFEAIAASFTPAPAKGVSAIPGLPPASVQICYEVVFPGLTAGDPAFILTQSNDAWFGNWHGPAQHAATARMRSVEEGVPLIRAAANGYSGSVDAYGRWTDVMGPDADGHLDVSLPDQQIATRYERSLTNIALLLIMLSATLSTLLARREVHVG